MKTYLFPHSISYPVNLPNIYSRLLLAVMLTVFAFCTYAQENLSNTTVSGINSQTEQLQFIKPKKVNGTAEAQPAKQFNLPLVLNSFDIAYKNRKIVLNWVTGKEKELSHFVIERSTNGSEFSEVGVVTASGNSDVKRTYSFTDNTISHNQHGVLYYRLRMVDMEKRYQHSQVRLVRLDEAAGNDVSISAYPNPVTSELRVTIPSDWQGKPVKYEMYNANGQVVKSESHSMATQTEVLNVTDIVVGLYIVKVTTGSETSVQRIIKAK